MLVRTVCKECFSYLVIEVLQTFFNEKTIQVSCGLVLLLLFSCTPFLEAVQETVSLYQTKMDEVAKVWDVEAQKLGEPDREKDATWLNVGLRYPCH